MGQVEIDKNAQKVLKKHWPDVPLHDDVTTAIDWADEIGLTGNVDLVCGGFPCQDVSVAGRRAGLAGERSGLFFDALAFATHVKAKRIILENVPGLLSSNQGRDFGVVLASLADAGYSNIEWRVLDSQFFGVAQRRRRVFIIASVGTEPFKQVLAERESGTGHSTPSKSKRKNSSSTTAGSTGADSGNGIGSDLVGSLCASDYKFPQQQQVMENKVVIQDAEGNLVARMRGFGDYEMDTTASTLKSRDYKDVTDIVVSPQQ